jgi:hypothetical protein
MSEMNDEEVRKELEKRNAKTFGTPERCRERLQRFLELEKETVPIKVVHEDITDAAEILVDLGETIPDIDERMNLVMECYQAALVDAYIANEPTLQKDSPTYQRWKEEQARFLRPIEITNKNGLNVHIEKKDNE